MSADPLAWVRERFLLDRGLLHPSAASARWLIGFVAFGVIGFILAATALSMVITDRRNIDEINTFSKNVLQNYLTNKCVECYPTENLTYALNASLVGHTGDVRMFLRDDALAADQFVTGLATPCDECVNSVGYDWTVAATAAVVDGHGIVGEANAIVTGEPYDLSVYGLTYDPLGIWQEKSDATISDKGFGDRCRGATATSMYVVAISSDLIQDVCCEYVICMCALPGPREWCTRQLLSASDPVYANAMNCQSGNLPGGCGCGQDVC